MGRVSLHTEIVRDLDSQPSTIFHLNYIMHLLLTLFVSEDQWNAGLSWQIPFSSAVLEVQEGVYFKS